MKTKLKGDNRSLTKKFGNRFFVGLFNHVSAIKRFQFSILFFVFFLSLLFGFFSFFVVSSSPPKAIETTKADDSTDGISSDVCHLLRSKGDRNQDGRRLYRSSRRLLRVLSCSPSEDRSLVMVLTASPSSQRTATLAGLTASLPYWRILVLMAINSSYVVVSFRKAIATTSVFSLGPNGVDFVFSLLLRQNTDRNHNVDRLSRSSSRRRLRLLSSSPLGDRSIQLREHFTRGKCFKLWLCILAK